MKLYLAGLLAAVSVNVLHLDNLGYELYNIDQLIDLVHIDNIDHLLLEEFTELRVHLLQQLWVLFGKKFHVLCQ